MRVITFLCIARFASDRDGFVRVIVRIKKMSYRKNIRVKNELNFRLMK